APGMDASVRDQLRQGKPGDLPADGVEARQDDGLGRVVDDQVYARGLLKGTDVAALAADDAALHLVRRQVHDRHGVLRGVVGGDTLDGRYDHVARLVVGLFLGLPLDRAGDADGIFLGVFANGLQEHLLGRVRGKAAHALQRNDLL